MSQRLLLAEDEPAVRRALVMSLSRAGFDVTAVDDGAPAIQLSDHVSFEIVVADLNMPVVGGLDVVRHYKRQFGPAVCCVILTGEDCDDARATCLAAGADDVILKPTTPAELRRRLVAVAGARGNAA